MLRPSAKTQGSNERLHGEVVASSLTSPRLQLESRAREVKTKVYKVSMISKLIYNSQLFSPILLRTETHQAQGFTDFETRWSYIPLKTKLIKLCQFFCLNTGCGSVSCE